MKTSISRLAVAAVVMLGATCIASLPGGSGALAAGRQDNSPLVFTGGNLVRDGKVLRNAFLVVRDGKVESIGGASDVKAAGARKVALDGKYIIPGMISAHVHVSNVDGIRPRAYTDANTLRQLGVFARYGFTTVLSLGGEQEPAFKARDSQNTATLDRARIYLSGDIVNGKTPEEARTMVAAVGARKPDFIKIRVDDNLGATSKMPPEVYRAVIEEAHRQGLRVSAHVFYLDDAKDLLRAGVDMIAHSIRDRDIDDEFIKLMKARDVPYCPTLTRDVSTFVYESTPAFFKDPFFLREADPEIVAQLQDAKRQEAVAKSKSAQAYKAALVVAKRNLEKAADAGLSVVLGTDSGPQPERFQGYFEHLELEMMVESGLTPAQALRAATVDAVRALKADSVGTLTPKTWADFVVLDSNPLENIGNTRSISSVWIAGNQVKR
jgi:imidazolonepropionase-like amidohydrolase